MSRDVAVSFEHEDAQPVCSTQHDIVDHKAQSVQRTDTASIRKNYRRSLRPCVFHLQCIYMTVLAIRPS